MRVPFLLHMHIVRAGKLYLFLGAELQRTQIFFMELTGEVFRVVLRSTS